MSTDSPIVIGEHEETTFKVLYSERVYKGVGEPSSTVKKGLRRVHLRREDFCEVFDHVIYADTYNKFGPDLVESPPGKSPLSEIR